MGKRIQYVALASAARADGATIEIDLPEGFDWILFRILCTALTATPSLVPNLKGHWDANDTDASFKQFNAFAPTSPPESETIFFGMLDGMSAHGSIDQFQVGVLVNKPRLFIVPDDTDSCTYSVEVMMGIV